MKLKMFQKCMQERDEGIDLVLLLVIKNENAQDQERDIVDVLDLGVNLMSAAHEGARGKEEGMLNLSFNFQCTLSMYMYL